MNLRRALTLASLIVAACAPGGEGSDTPDSDQGEVRIDTSTAQARAQYDASLDFVKRYRPTCGARRRGSGKRVLISGFGRFMSNTDNATGRIVSALSGVPYPESEAPQAGEVDLLGPQLSVGVRTVEWPRSGQVEVCAMILPVVWDVAPALLLRELQAFQPDLVIMNGIANATQDLWIELGGVNEAARMEDGTGLLTPYDPDASRQVPLLEDAPRTHPNRMSWDLVRQAAETRRLDEITADPALGDVLTGVALAGFPRSGNTYLCNNITFVTSYLMDSPRVSARLMIASDPLEDRSNDLHVALDGDYRKVPRTFLHWPSDMDRGERAEAGARMLAALADAQLAATDKDPPSAGNDAMADPDLRGGDTF